MSREQRRKKKAPDTGQGAGAAGSGQIGENPTGENLIYKLPEAKACAQRVRERQCCVCGERRERPVWPYLTLSTFPDLSVCPICRTRGLDGHWQRPACSVAEAIK